MKKAMNTSREWAGAAGRQEDGQRPTLWSKTTPVWHQTWGGETWKETKEKISFMGYGLS